MTSHPNTPRCRSKLCRTFVFTESAGTARILRCNLLWRNAHSQRPSSKLQFPCNSQPRAQGLRRGMRWANASVAEL